MLTAWPGTDTALDNVQFQTCFAAAHLGLGDPELSTHVGAPIEAPNRAGTGWRKISAAMDCSQGHKPLAHRQLPREGRVLEAARRPPRQDIP